MVDEQAIKDLVKELRGNHDSRTLEALTCELIKELEYQVIEGDLDRFHVKGEFSDSWGIHWTHSNWVCN